MAAQIQNKYDEDFKKSLVSLHQNGKTQTQLCNEYGVSKSALSKWIKQYSTVETDDGQVLTSRQVKELQKRNAQLEEENLILKKRLPSSRHTQTTIRCCTQTQISAFHKNLMPGITG